MKRRRLLIAFAVLACIGGFVAWRMSWRGDPRFVGRWTAARKDGDPQTFVFEFSTNGTGAVYSDPISANSRKPMLRMNWWIKDHRLFIQNQPRETGIERALLLLNDFYQLLIGGQTATNGQIDWTTVMEYQLEEISPGRCQFYGASDSARGEEWEIMR